MATIWSPRARTDRWLEVEIAACAAWAELGAVPRDAVEKIRAASYSLEEMAVFEAETQHDVTAFLRSVQKSLGPEGRYVHYGLTSSDVVDTGLALQIVAACDVLDAELARLLTTLECLAVRHRDTLAIGRTHGVHA
ncbi:MAG: adenylosuccinate lyase, partial [Chloroflexi bacterium]|nr:adenylosuccinate lyase [Chloroflexota bacterium]